MMLGQFFENVVAALIVILVVSHFELMNPYLAGVITFAACYLLDGLPKIIGAIFS